MDITEITKMIEAVKQIIEKDIDVLNVLFN